MICLAISPHMDDAVLCAGGYLAQRARDGTEVVILTVCAGAPPPGPLSPLAASFHADCGLGANAVDVRRAEDAEAAAAIGATACWLDIPDAVYRRHGGHPAYRTPQELFGPPGPADDHHSRVVAAEIATLFPRVVELLIPLGVGGHVDHRITRRIGEEVANAMAGVRTAWYEESTYQLQQGAAAWTHVSTDGLEPRRRELATAAHQQKLTALEAYRSQMPMLRAACTASAASTDLDTVLAEECLWSLP